MKRTRNLMTAMIVACALLAPGALWAAKAAKPATTQYGTIRTGTSLASFRITRSSLSSSSTVRP